MHEVVQGSAKRTNRTQSVSGNKKKKEAYEAGGMKVVATY
jgi:hypothetical protein